MATAFTNGARARPFSPWELGLAVRYLRAKRKDGGVALISIISFLGVMAAVALLICTMAIMNGFRSDLLSRIVGFQGHIYIQGPAIENASREALIARLRKIPGVVQVAPKVETQTLVLANGDTQGAIVRGVSPETLRDTPLVSRHITQGSITDFGKGEYGGDTILMGARLADALGVRAGDQITLISPSSVTPFGSALQPKTYVVGGLFSVGMERIRPGLRLHAARPGAALLRQGGRLGRGRRQRQGSRPPGRDQGADRAGCRPRRRWSPTGATATAASSTPCRSSTW